MTKLIEEQLKRAGLVKELDKIAQGSESKQEVWQEGLKRLVLPEEKENTAPPSTSSNKKDDAEDNTAEVLARSVIPDEFTMAVYLLLVACEPKKYKNVFGAMFAGLAAFALKNDLEEKFGKEITEKKMAEIIEKAKKEAKNKEWWKG